jgi:GST-like protein
MGGVGPMFGQAHHFMRAKKDEIPYGSERYGNEAKRLYGVMDRHLASTQFFAKDYSIADMAIFPWCRLHGRQRQSLDDFPNVRRWFETIAARPAVAKDMAQLEDKAGDFDAESWSNLFGERQYRRP